MVEALARVHIATTLSPRQRPGLRVLHESVGGPHQVEDRLKAYAGIPSFTEGPVQHDRQLFRGCLERGYPTWRRRRDYSSAIAMHHARGPLQQVPEVVRQIGGVG